MGVDRTHLGVAIVFGSVLGRRAGDMAHGWPQPPWGSKAGESIRENVTVSTAHLSALWDDWQRGISAHLLALRLPRGTELIERLSVSR